MLKQGRAPRPIAIPEVREDILRMLPTDLEESLGVEVDVVTEASVSPYMRDRVLDEAVAL